ncbi:hypothetical protein GIB67_018596 [Kingdonia uniflora]|uniref:PPC domain-containing protein n=1 Tax=Kingdonia uniflora TaxID=39325 RepID=A0A7J7L889_9MAGN|nr:hypothetical protein GIB67_018596 [Kingdonia uniflora]
MVETMKRARGRPPGSKNKPKPAFTVPSNIPDSTMLPVILEIPTGQDIMKTIINFSKHQNFGLSILTSSGAVNNVSFRNPNTVGGGATITFKGQFDIVSISATFLPRQYPGTNSVTILLAGQHNQIIGGSVTGGLVAATTVYVVAAAFNQLPTNGDEFYTNISIQESPVSEEKNYLPQLEQSRGTSSMYSDFAWRPNA